MLSEKTEWEISDWGIFKWNNCNKSPVLHFKFSVFYFVHLKSQYKETEIHIFLRRLEEKFTKYICFMITKDQIGRGGGDVGFITGNSRFISSIFCSVSKSYEACKKILMSCKVVDWIVTILCLSLVSYTSFFPL